jgi:hypothetical protein
MQTLQLIVIRAKDHLIDSLNNECNNVSGFRHSVLWKCTVMYKGQYLVGGRSSGSV